MSISVKFIIAKKSFGLGARAIRNGLRELAEKGYLKGYCADRSQDKDGKYEKSKLIFRAYPGERFGDVDNGDSQNGDSQNATPNKNISNKNINNKTPPPILSLPDTATATPTRGGEEEEFLDKDLKSETTAKADVETGPRVVELHDKPPAKRSRRKRTTDQSKANPATGKATPAPLESAESAPSEVPLPTALPMPETPDGGLRFDFALAKLDGAMMMEIHRILSGVSPELRQDYLDELNNIMLTKELQNPLVYLSAMIMRKNQTFAGAASIRLKREKADYTKKVAEDAKKQIAAEQQAILEAARAKEAAGQLTPIAKKMQAIAARAKGKKANAEE